MSFSRSKRFSPPLNESLPGPAHYYVNWGSLGLLKPMFSKYPRITDTCRKTTPKKSAKSSPQNLEKQGKSPGHKKYSSTELHKNMTIPEFSEKQMAEDATKKQEIPGVEPEQVKYQIPGLHKNVTFRKRMEQATSKLEINPPIQQGGKQVDQSPNKQYLKKVAAHVNDNCKSVSRVPMAAKSLHRVLPVRSDFFREQTAKELLIGLYEDKNDHSDDDTSEVSLTERSCEISINNILFDDHNKENLQSSTDDEVGELLDLCMKETYFLRKMDMLRFAKEGRKKGLL